MRPTIEAQRVSKTYRLPRSRRPTLKASLVAQLNRTPTIPELVWALRDLDFAVERGSALGIMGHNGAGKSTLLRLLCGVGKPTSGTVHTEGRVAGVLTLGTGFHGELTGRENLELGAVLNGMTREQAEDRREMIATFAELDDVIDHPLRTYSSGMYMRLAFSTAIHSDPEVLIIDEVLAVGDSKFQRKCLDRLHAFRKAGGTMVVASHVPEQLLELCDQVLVLENGHAVTLDRPEVALEAYEERLHAGKSRSAPEAAAVGSRSGTQAAVISSVEVYGRRGQATTSVASTEPATFEIRYQCHVPVVDFSVTLGVFFGATKCLELGIDSCRERFGVTPAAVGTIRCTVDELPLAAGSYFLVVGLYAPHWGEVYDYHWQMHDLTVVETDRNGRECASGFVAARGRWEVPARGEQPLLSAEKKVV